MKHIYDCHGKTHDEVMDELENWIIIHHNTGDMCEIIAGKSTEMLKICMTTLELLGMQFAIPSNNPGMIILL
jgi:hypothetical protein